MNDRKLVIREPVKYLNIAYGSVQDIVVNDICFRRVAAKLMPNDLNFMGERDHVDIAKDIIFQAESDPIFMKRIITGDETWVYEYNMQFGHQVNEWRAPNKPRPKILSRFQSRMKVILTIFIDYNGVVHYEFLPDQTVDKGYYSGIMRCLRAVGQKKVLWSNDLWILYHDNAMSHNVIIIRELLTQNKANTI